MILFPNQIVHFCDKSPLSPWHTLLLRRLTAPFVRGHSVLCSCAGAHYVTSVGGSWPELLSDCCGQRRCQAGQPTLLQLPSCCETARLGARARRAALELPGEDVWGDPGRCRDRRWKLGVTLGRDAGETGEMCRRHGDRLPCQRSGWLRQRGTWRLDGSEQGRKLTVRRCSEKTENNTSDSS